MTTWSLDPQTTHLNHGSFGATPVEVLARQQELRTQMEANPVAFMLRTYQPLLEQSRSSLASFLGVDAAGLVFVPNATYGVNSVLRSVERHLGADAEIVITTHTYNACRNAVVDMADRIGARVVVADIPFPIASPDQATQAVLNVITDATALVLLDHVTSATGLVMPIAEVAAAVDPSVMVLVDGAHAPGMIDLDVASLGVAFYTANCHKWICAPKGSAFLWVDEQHRDSTAAAVVSHGFNNAWHGSGSHFHAQFDWTGTDDPTAILCVGTALEVMSEHHPQGWAGIRQANHEMAVAGRDVVAKALGVDQPAPDSMIGSIASLPVPPLAEADPGVFDPLTNELHRDWAIEVPVFAWPESPQRLVRISAQQYNTPADYDRLGQALGAIL